MFARIPCAVERHEVLSGPSTYPCQTAVTYLWLQQLSCHKGNLLVCAGAEFRPDCGSATKAEYNRLREYSIPLPRRVCQ